MDTNPPHNQQPSLPPVVTNPTIANPGPAPAKTRRRPGRMVTTIVLASVFGLLAGFGGAKLSVGAMAFLWFLAGRAN